METTFELGYALDTFYFLICGALVMWMAAGFAMLEAGLVRAKNTTEILTKNIALFAIACTMYMICGYGIMYGGDDWSLFLSGIVSDGATDVAEDPATYAPSADFFFQVVFVATAMSIVSGAVAERMKLWAFLTFSVVMTGFIYPMEGAWTWGGVSVFGMYTLGDLGFSDFAGSGIVHMAGAAAALAGVLVLGARKGKYTADGKVNAIPGANLLQYPDISYATANGESVKANVDNDWYVENFIPTVQQRGAAIIKARGASSAASAASAAIDHMRDWAMGTNGKWVSMGVYSKGNSYGIDEDIVYALPITCENGEWKEITGLEISNFSREMMGKTEKELISEREAIADMI